MTNINTGALPAALWRSHAAASGLRADFLGTGVPGSGIGTGPCAVAVQSIPRVRGNVAFAVPVTPKTAPAVQLGQPNSDNYSDTMSVSAIGVGAAGPPPHREPV